MNKYTGFTNLRYSNRILYLAHPMFLITKILASLKIWSYIITGEKQIFNVIINGGKQMTQKAIEKEVINQTDTDLSYMSVFASLLEKKGCL